MNTASAERGQIVQQLEKLVRKLKVHCRRAREVRCNVYPAQNYAEPYIVELSKERFFRRVAVDPLTVKRLMLGRTDAALLRELRTNLLAVARLG